jgi:hypothetical protein
MNYFEPALLLATVQLMMLWDFMMVNWRAVLPDWSQGKIWSMILISCVFPFVGYATMLFFWIWCELEFIFPWTQEG